MLSDSAGKRLASFRKSLGMSQRVFATNIGVSGGLVGQIEADMAPPSRSFLEKVSDRYGISSDWLLRGTEPQYFATSKSSEADIIAEMPDGSIMPIEAKSRQVTKQSFKLIPRMELSVSAGSGVVPIENEYSDALAFSTDWLKKNSVNSDLSVLVSVKGDSMAPSIPDGSLVLVHLPEKNVEREGVYAFNRGDASFVKRLVPSAVDESGRPRSIAIISNNPAFPPEVLTGRNLNELRIVGRVRCVMTTL